MKIDLIETTVRDVVLGYLNKAEEGVVGYNGRLNIRPAYQREFVYKDKQRDAVIDTIMKGFPLNVLYWAKTGDDAFEVLDGQQRTISLCEFHTGKFSIQLNGAVKYFHNLTHDEKALFLGYKLFVYVCEGEDSERLAWFRTINISGEKLTEQELRNAVYTGAWLTDAKRHFSRTGCPAAAIGARYLKGSAIRQDYLETALDWISGGEIVKHMAERQHKPNANELWLHFQRVVAWVDALFGAHYRKEMKGVDFGKLYSAFHDAEHDSEVLEAEVSRLMKDEDATCKPGIYSYVFDRDERHLSIRAFNDNQRREAYERQMGVCPQCSDHRTLSLDAMEADHITPWHAGGRTSADNCQMLCKHHNRLKSGK